MNVVTVPAEIKKKPVFLLWKTRALSMGYKKDISSSLAYGFKLSQFLVKSLAYAHGEIIRVVNCEI